MDLETLEHPSNVSRAVTVLECLKQLIASIPERVIPNHGWKGVGPKGRFTCPVEAYFYFRDSQLYSACPLSWLFIYSCDLFRSLYPYHKAERLLSAASRFMGKGFIIFYEGTLEQVRDAVDVAIELGKTPTEPEKEEEDDYC